MQSKPLEKVSDNMSGYNGWKNYETWNCHLWYGETFSDTIRDMLEDIGDVTKREKIEQTKEVLRQMIDSEIEDLGTLGLNKACMVMDFINASVKEINFDEIAESIIESIESE